MNVVLEQNYNLPISSPKANVISFVCPSDISPKYCLNMFKKVKLLESESGIIVISSNCLIINLGCCISFVLCMYLDYTLYFHEEYCTYV